MNVTMLEKVLYHLHNWFVRERLELGDASISDGQLPEEAAEAVPVGAYYRIQGTLLNDGLYLRGEEELRDEESDMVVSVLAIPRPLLSLVDEIDAWQQKNGAATDGPYYQEQFGDYKYTLKGFSTYGSANGIDGWRLAFRDQLTPFRKMY